MIAAAAVSLPAANAFALTGPGQDFARAAALAPGGKIVAVGSSQTSAVGSIQQFGVARVLGGGSLDHSFSGDGVRRITFDGGPGGGEAHAVAVAGSGKIVVAGSIEGGDSVDRVAVARLNPGGTLDQSFSGDGKRILSVGPGSAVATGVVIQGGKVVLSVAEHDLNGEWAVLRLRADGKLDDTFAGDGSRSISFPESVANALAASGQRVVVAGTVDTGGGEAFGAARLTDAGNLDPSFSGDGKRTVQMPGSADNQANAVAVDGAGRVVLGGTSYRPGGGSLFAFARLRANGSPDPAFSDDGRRLVDFDSGNDYHLVRDLEVRGDGRITGVGDLSDGVRIAVCRMTGDGTLDPSFSDDGKRGVGFASATTYGVEGFAAVPRGGGLVAIGPVTTPGDRFFGFAALTGGGQLDNGFSQDGKLLVGFPP